MFFLLSPGFGTEEHSHLNSRCLLGNFWNPWETVKTTLQHIQDVIEMNVARTCSKHHIGKQFFCVPVPSNETCITCHKACSNEGINECRALNTWSSSSTSLTCKHVFSLFMIPSIKPIKDWRNIVHVCTCDFFCKWFRFQHGQGRHPRPYRSEIQSCGVCCNRQKRKWLNRWDFVDVWCPPKWQFTKMAIQFVILIYVQSFPLLGRVESETVFLFFDFESQLLEGQHCTVPCSQQRGVDGATQDGMKMTSQTWACRIHPHTYFREYWNWWKPKIIYHYLSNFGVFRWFDLLIIDRCRICDFWAQRAGIRCLWRTWDVPWFRSDRWNRWNRWNIVAIAFDVVSCETMCWSKVAGLRDQRGVVMRPWLKVSFDLSTCYQLRAVRLKGQMMASWHPCWSLRCPTCKIPTNWSTRSVSQILDCLMLVIFRG